MLKGKKCTDGTPLNGLHKSSRKKVIKICDDCGEESSIMYCNFNYSRKRRGEDKDYCRKCAGKYPLPGTVVSSKDYDKSKMGIKFRSSGYLRVLNSKGEYVDEHRLVAEEILRRPLKADEYVHHVDGDKLNNAPDNLYVCGASEHEALHKQLTSVAFDLVKSGHVQFNPRQGKYTLRHDLEVSLMPISLGFEDVVIQQSSNKCASRSDADTSSEVIKGVRLRVPLLAANMSTVTNASFCIELAKQGALGVMHRAADKPWILTEVKEIAKHCEWVAASIGVGKDQFDFCKDLVKAGANIIVIDIAHGYAPSVIDLGKKIKKEFPTVKLVVGNTTNLDMLYEVYSFADALKVGIGAGLACTTKDTAGCHEKQFTAVLKFKEAAKKFNLPIIGDGGIRGPGDFAKAIASGANSAMAGSIFARCPESAAPMVEGKKLYAGMASEWVQTKWRGGLKPGTCAEGKVVMLEVGTSAKELIQRYEGALRSGITYAGATDVPSFQDLVEFIRK